MNLLIVKGTSRLIRTSFNYNRLCCNCLTVSSVQYSDHHSVNGGDDSERKAKPYRIWMLRFTQENSFLSWSRNAAICAGVGATLNVLDGQTPFDHVIGAGFFDLGVLFMTIGSVHHIASSFGLRHHVQISWLRLLWIITYSAGIWLFYFGLVKNKLKTKALLS